MGGKGNGMGEKSRLLDANAVQPGGTGDGSASASSAIANEQVGDGADVRGAEELAHWICSRGWEAMGQPRGSKGNIDADE